MGSSFFTLTQRVGAWTRAAGACLRSGLDKLDNDPPELRPKVAWQDDSQKVLGMVFPSMGDASSGFYFLTRDEIAQRIEIADQASYITGYYDNAYTLGVFPPEVPYLARALRQLTDAESLEPASRSAHFGVFDPSHAKGIRFNDGPITSLNEIDAPPHQFPW